MASLLEHEAAETPALASRQFERLRRELPGVVARIEQFSPTLIATIARGSSDNAAAFAAYLAGLRLALATASVPPSLASVYQCTLRLERAAVLAISQSGASPDLCAAVAGARDGGALTLGVTNAADSALAHTVDIVIEMGAGPELAVAATKTFLLSLTALLHLIAEWTRDSALVAALEELPATLTRCDRADWNAAVQLLAEHDDAFVVARGPMLPVGRELALKLKEVCGIHAEAVSAAELLHGPISLASPSLPAIVLAGDAPTRASIGEALSQLHAAGASVLLLSPHQEHLGQKTHVVSVPTAPDPLLQPVVTLHTAYPLTARLARARGRDPDHPPHLAKITRTI